MTDSLKPLRIVYAWQPHGNRVYPLFNVLATESSVKTRGRVDVMLSSYFMILILIVCRSLAAERRGSIRWS